MKTKAFHFLAAAVLTLAALLAGQSAWATTKTVTYTMTSHEYAYQGSQKKYTVVFTRNGAPFETTTETTYSSVIPESYLLNNAGSFTLALADGFSLNLKWSTGSSVSFVGQNIQGNGITYTVKCSGDRYYYVTNVTMSKDDGTSAFVNTNYGSEWQFNHNYTLTSAFGKISITYSDAPALTIFGSDGENKYKIQDKHDLRHLANYVNNGGGDCNCNGLTFNQTDNITCDNTYVPIGYSDEAYFRGTYDGKGNTISGITVSSAADGRALNIALFGMIKNATIKNVVLANSTFTGSASVSGIVGYNISGTVSNCIVKSDVTIKASIKSSERLGSIVGWHKGTDAKVIGCVSAATVSLNGKDYCQDIGGIVGNMTTNSIIKDCLFTGSIIDSNYSSNKGGIAGYCNGNPSNISNNYYTTGNFGGLQGSDVNGARLARAVTLGIGVTLSGTETGYDVSGLTAIGTSALSYNDGTSTTIYSGAGQTLTLNHADREGYTFGGFTATNGGTISGSTLTVPAADVTASGIYTAIPWSGSGTQSKPYLIEYPSQLDLLATNVNGGTKYQGVHFLQTKDLVYDGTENNYVPIGFYHSNTDRASFQGYYDGGGKTISGINVSRTGTEYADGSIGLFGYISGYRVENVVLANCTFTGHYNVGGIAGYNLNALVKNCRVESTVTIQAGSNASSNLGGIVGNNYGEVWGCISGAAISDNDYSSVSNCGGIAGYQQGDISYSLYTGSTVNGAENIGSIAGNFEYIGTRFCNSYYTTAGLGAVKKADRDGARRARTVTLGTGVILSESQNVYNVSGLTDFNNDALGYNDGSSTILYSGEGQKLKLSYNGEVPAGSTAVFTSTGGTISGNTLTMPAADVTITAILMESTCNITAHSAGFAGQTHYWTTFYHNTINYKLPAGAKAFTMKSDKALYLVGDGSVIPAGCAVIIMADTETIPLTVTYETATQESGNILKGVVADTAKTDLTTGSEKVCVMGKSGSTFGFFEFSGTTVPANKAYYLK